MLELIEGVDTNTRVNLLSNNDFFFGCIDPVDTEGIICLRNDLWFELFVKCRCDVRSICCYTEFIEFHPVSKRNRNRSNLCVKLIECISRRKGNKLQQKYTRWIIGGERDSVFVTRLRNGRWLSPFTILSGT